MGNLKKGEPNLKAKQINARGFSDRHRKSLSGFLGLKNFGQENSGLSWEMKYTETDLTKPQAAALRSTIFLL